MVRAAGFEPAVSRFQAEYDNQASLYPDDGAGRGNRTHSTHKETSFTDWLAYFNELVQLMVAIPRVELGAQGSDRSLIY